MKMRGDKLSTDISLKAMMTDALNWLVWANSKDGTDRPISIFNKLMGIEEENNTMAFSSGEEFEEYRRNLINGN